MHRDRSGMAAWECDGFTSAKREMNAGFVFVVVVVVIWFCFFFSFLLIHTVTKAYGMVLSIFRWMFHL